MKLSKLVLAMGVTTALFGMAHTAQAETASNTVSKKITLTAQINDALFVSKPDGSTWYGTEELSATDYTQKNFEKSLPVRIWSSNADVNVSLAQPLKMSSGKFEMKGVKVELSSNAGDTEVKFGKAQTIKQVSGAVGNYDEVHNLKISAAAPDAPVGVSTNGSYSGDLVMVFEPVAAAGGGETTK
ncbi:fimbrial assembly protein [Burkholderia sp. Ac-20384]|uniref:CS1 type fimbrial major subunit n=1 Tax=Burkholderia sp. Ac-20384 TaxID=2703902 RepID=UPI0019825CB5|nr:CS1 type fimbrial major subunit [Burkholderia sp. Ac-20384]MBN3823260.1 fimbrial assembly protein [Burkholderia sp. Ac-20384]